MRQSHIAVIGAPMDLGAGRRGVDMGPSALRVAGLNQKLADLGYHTEDLGNVVVDQPESLPTGPTNARYLPQIAHTCARLAEMVERAADQGQVPLVLGGDHSAAVGTVAGMSRHLHKTGRKLGLLWIDAHADMNTPESSPSGNVHGMPLACVIGLGPAELTGIACHVPMVDPENVAIVGLRSVDDIERLNVRGAGVHPFTMRDIDERGMRTVIQEAIQAVSSGTSGFHLSFDLDAVDPSEAPGVGTPIHGGITYREAHLAMEIVCDSGSMTSLEMVELNPVMDVANRTAILGVELIMSALGKRIL
ncbi:MAG: arginase [Bryobacterales bacterium]|jgi:arginase|nr:arginase [Bryobacterales bacterium]